MPRATFNTILIALILSLTAATIALAGDSKQPPDLSGEWRLDPARSQMPMRVERPGGGARGVQQFTGHWKGGHLVVQHPSWRGGKITETYSIDDGAHTLTVRTQVDSDGSMPALDFKRVYQRVTRS